MEFECVRSRACRDVDEQFLWSPYVYARRLAEMSMNSSFGHRMYMLEGLLEMSIKNSFGHCMCTLSVRNMCMARGLARDVDQQFLWSPYVYAVSKKSTFRHRNDCMCTPEMSMNSQ